MGEIKIEDMSFEQAMNELENVVTSLEGSQIALDLSLIHI